MLKISRLAFKDYLHEWPVSLCFILGLATVLGPILVLFGLKFGIVGKMIDDLVAEPGNREIRPVNSGRFPPSWFQRIQNHPEVAYVIPRTRNIASTIELKSPTARRIVLTELVPTSEGDPLLPTGSRPENAFESLILSQSVAGKLRVIPGQMISGSISRRYHGKSERVHIPLRVQSVAPAGAFGRDGAFCSLELLEAMENYRDGHAVPLLGWNGSTRQEREYYPGFRLFARSIYDVGILQNQLMEDGIEVRTRARDIQIVERLDRSLGRIYWAIAIVGLLGCALSLGANFRANVDRKRKSLALLRLVGFRTIDMICFPVLQGLITAVAGWILAVALFYLTRYGINQLLADQLAPGQQTCRLLPVHFLVSLLLTCIPVILVAIFSGLKAASIEPSEGLREQ